MKVSARLKPPVLEVQASVTAEPDPVGQLTRCPDHEPDATGKTDAAIPAAKK